VALEERLALPHLRLASDSDHRGPSNFGLNPRSFDAWPLMLGTATHLDIYVDGSRQVPGRSGAYAARPARAASPNPPPSCLNWRPASVCMTSDLRAKKP